MKKMIYKRFTSLFLSVVMCVVILPAFSINVKAADNVEEKVFEAIYLESLNDEADSSFKDISNIGIGKAIPSYKVEAGQAVATSAQYIPILLHNELVSIAVITLLKGEISTVELTNELVDGINNFDGEKVALIFDNRNTYIFSENEYKSIKTYENEITVDSEEVMKYKDSIFDLQEESKRRIETEDINMDTIFELENSKKAELDNSLFNTEDSDNSIAGNSAINTVTYPTSKYLSVPIVPQHGLPICWAAAVAGIGNYKTDYFYTAEDVSDYIYGDNEGGNTYVALLALQGLYDLDGVDVYYAPAFVVIKDHIYNSNPMYVRLYGVKSSSTVNHALVFIGYYDYSSGSYDGSIRYNDSNDTSYKTLYFTTDGSYSITYNGITSYIDQHVSLY